METRYLNFPVAQIPYILTDRYEALNAVIAYAVVSYARTKGITLDAAGEFLVINVGDHGLLKENACRCHTGTKSLTSINMHTAFEFRDCRKSDFDTLCLVANLACRSIIGKHSYCLVRKDLIFSRMSGEDKCIHPRFYKPKVKKLAGGGGRRRWNKVRAVLETVYGLKFYAPHGTRGMYISYDLTPEDLAFKVESMKANRKKKQARNDSAELKRVAQQRLWAIEHRTS